MAVGRGTWATFTNGSDPAGSPTIDEGSDRKFILAVLGECDTNTLSVTVTVGGVAPSESLEYALELGSGGADLAINVYIWNESAINSMSGTSISWSDLITWSKISWSYMTVTGADQDTSVYDDDSSSSATSLTITWPSSTDANGLVLAFGVTNTANRGPIGFDTGITSRQQYEVADYAAGIGDGPGGSSVESTMAITNDEAASSAMLGLGVFFAESGGIIHQAMYHYRNHGVI